jgi:hypothetical protein
MTRGDFFTKHPFTLGPMLWFRKYFRRKFSQKIAIICNIEPWLLLSVKWQQCNFRNYLSFPPRKCQRKKLEPNLIIENSLFADQSTNTESFFSLIQHFFLTGNCICLISQDTESPIFLRTRLRKIWRQRVERQRNTLVSMSAARRAVSQSRVARWFIFKPKIPIWVIFYGP